ncbi:MAG: DUF1990 family protein [Solirubrobacteraceae bacterium]
MPRRPTATNRWLTALTWPVGVALTSWDYMWRSTPLHRRELSEPPGPTHLPPKYPDGVDDAEVQGAQAGRGPIFHRLYRTRIRDAELDAPALMYRLKSDLNQAAPTEFARFVKVRGEPGEFAVGDEYVVRMPGPWDGPVRVIAADEHSFRLATLATHLEAGQIEFRVVAQEPLTFEIESWARSADRFVDLLYQRVHMAKEIQLHMWISFLEGVTKLSGGRMTGGIEIDTRRVDGAFPA